PVLLTVVEEFRPRREREEPVGDVSHEVGGVDVRRVRYCRGDPRSAKKQSQPGGQYDRESFPGHEKPPCSIRERSLIPPGPSGAIPYTNDPGAGASDDRSSAWVVTPDRRGRASRSRRRAGARAASTPGPQAM